jgi:bacillithiol system protein YtxJ
VQEFVRRQPEIPIFLVDVLSQRPLSQVVAVRLGIQHESPQAIVLRRGTPCWHASHYDVTAEALAKEVDGV